jgi:hypothetical protein
VLEPLLLQVRAWPASEARSAGCLSGAGKSCPDVLMRPAVAGRIRLGVTRDGTAYAETLTAGTVPVTPVWVTGAALCRPWRRCR